MKGRQFIIVIAGVLLIEPFTLGKDLSDQEHFVAGEVRFGLSWDNISAMHDGILKFGGAAGVHVLNGLELGYEQQFIVPDQASTESRSWGYVRLVPFRNWPINPFVAMRFGYYLLPEEGAVALGGGGGAVLFVDNHFAFEASIFSQAVFSRIKPVEQQMDVDWRVVIFF